MKPAILDHVSIMIDHWYNNITGLLQDSGAATSDVLKLVIMEHKDVVDGHRYDYELCKVGIDYGDDDFVRFLIDRGVNPNAMPMDANPDEMPSDTLLNMAIWEDDYEIVKLLLNNGADVHIKTMHTSSPLVATTCLRVPIAEMLIKYGADVNGQDSIGNTALHYAVERRDHRLIQLLMCRGADDTIVNKEGKTPYEDTVSIIN